MVAGSRYSFLSDLMRRGASHFDTAHRRTISFDPRTAKTPDWINLSFAQVSADSAAHAGEGSKPVSKRLCQSEQVPQSTTGTLQGDLDERVQVPPGFVATEEFGVVADHLLEEQTEHPLEQRHTPNMAEARAPTAVKEEHLSRIATREIGSVRGPFYQTMPRPDQNQDEAGQIGQMFENSFRPEASSQATPDGREEKSVASFASEISLPSPLSGFRSRPYGLPTNLNQDGNSARNIAPSRPEEGPGLDAESKLHAQGSLDENLIVPNVESNLTRTSAGKIVIPEVKRVFESKHASAGHSQQTTPPREKDIARLAPTQTNALPAREIISDKYLKPHDSAAPRLLIKRLEVQVINQSPATQTSAAPPERQSGTKESDWESLSRYHVRRFLLGL